MIKIGLTGNIGCGKSTVAKMFRSFGAAAIDADQVIKGFYIKGSEVYDQVLEKFGIEILNEDKDISRKKLADIVFRDSEKLGVLERITHQALQLELRNWFDKLEEDSVAIVEASLILEKNMGKNYDKILVVYAPYEVSKERATNRGMQEEDFERRWKRQMDVNAKVKLADFVINNDGSLEKTKARTRDVYNQLYIWDTFRRLWDKTEAKGEFQEVYLEVVRRYSQPARHYHNLSHLVDVLRGVKNPILMVGIIGHDIIYTPGAEDNEEKSAEWTYNFCKLISSDGEFAEQAKTLVLATKHDAREKTELENEIVDRDLLIFGASEERFDEYDRGIRKEYEFVKDENYYRTRRAEILEGFIRTPMYHNPVYEEKYGERARKNLRRAIAKLR